MRSEIKSMKMYEAGHESPLIAKTCTVLSERIATAASMEVWSGRNKGENECNAKKQSGVDRVVGVPYSAT